MSRIQKAFFVLLALYFVLYLTGVSSVWRPVTGLIAFISGLLSLFQIARRGLRAAIWRLRNRLLLAYLFIAVVPVMLILTLVGIATYAVIGQVAIYLVNTQLTASTASLMGMAEGLARANGPSAELMVNRFSFFLRRRFSDFDVLVSGKNELRYPPGVTLAPPPPVWKNASGLVVRDRKLYAWAHVLNEGNEVTVLAPITNSLLVSLVPGLGEVNIVGYTVPKLPDQVPPKANALDFSLGAFYPLRIPFWDSPDHTEGTAMLVQTRFSAVLGKIFQTVDWGELALGLFVGVGVLFLIVELASLVAGVSLSRTITGAVHELYEGTQRVKAGDFSYRIRVKGNDQLAELGSSFNSMTANIERLIVVAKEKERLQSEIEIAREVQSQLFPKAAPSTRTLQLAGACSPARMVSGDYYDFLPLPHAALAFAIGDVAGKGISAALLMAAIQSTMRTQLSASNGFEPHRLSAARLVSNLNQQLYANTAPEKYATFYFALYDETNHSLTYANAGHLPPILVHQGNLQMLDSTGTVVGAFPFATYEEKTVPLDRGDILVAYTDGVVEPENVYGEMFGEERLKDLVLKYEQAELTEIIARTMEAVTEWTGSSELQDDMTILAARRI